MFIVVTRYVETLHELESMQSRHLGLPKNPRSDNFRFSSGTRPTCASASGCRASTTPSRASATTSPHCPTRRDSARSTPSGKLPFSNSTQDIYDLAVLLRLTIGYINFLAEIVSKDKNPDEAGSSRQATAPQQKKVVVHSAKGRRGMNQSAHTARISLFLNTFD